MHINKLRAGKKWKPDTAGGLHKKRREKDMESKRIFGLGKHLKALLDIINIKDARRHFHGVVVRKDGVAEVTDTHILLRVPLNQIDKDELPETLNVQEMKTDTWISLSALKNAYKSLNGKGTALEFLKNIFIRNGKDLALVSTDLNSVFETKESVETSKSNMQDFPKTESILKLDKDKVKFCIKFKPDLLKKLANVVDGLSEGKGNAVTFLFTGENDVAHLLYQVGQDKQGVGAVMPIKNTEDMDAVVSAYNKALNPGTEEEEQEEEPVNEKELVAV